MKNTISKLIQVFRIADNIIYIFSKGIVKIRNETYKSIQHIINYDKNCVLK